MKRFSVKNLPFEDEIIAYEDAIISEDSFVVPDYIDKMTICKAEKDVDSKCVKLEISLS